MNSLLLFSRRSRILEPSRPYSIHTLGSMSSAAAAADAPEEFGALAEYAVDDFMSEAASDVEVFATTEGHGDVSAEEIRFLARDPQAHDRVMSRVARLPRRALRRLVRAAGFDEPVWQTRIRRATAASLAEEVGASGTAAARHRSASSKRRSLRTRRRSSRSKRYGRPSWNPRTSFRTSSAPSTCTGLQCP
jgi:hypothetical protein